MLRIFSILILCLPQLVLAAPLTWDDCVRMVMENNNELLIQIKNVEAAKLRQSGSASDFFPEVSASLGYGQTEQLAPVPGLSSSFGANLVMSQNLFAGFSHMAKMDLNKAKTSMAEIDLQILKSRLSKDLKTAFENYIYAQRSIDLRKSIVKRREENLRLVELRFRGGRENRGSVLASQASLVEAKYEVNQAQMWVRQNKITLAKVLGLEDGDNLEVVGSVPTQTPPPADLPLGQLSKSTPQVERALYQEDAANADLKTARSKFFPNLSLKAELRNSDPRFFPDEKREWAVSASVSIPLFNGGRDYFETQAQTKAVLVASLQRAQILRDSRELLETALSNYLQAIERVQVNEAFVQSTSVRSEIGRMRYNNGLISFEDWSGIENELIDRQKKTLDSRRDRVTFEAAWESAQGKGILP